MSTLAELAVQVLGPAPWFAATRGLPLPQIADAAALDRLRKSGWWNKARIRVWRCPNRDLLAELLDAPIHGAVLLVRTDSEVFDKPLPENASDIEKAESGRQLIRSRWEVWSLSNLRGFREGLTPFTGRHGPFDRLAVCRCGRHGPLDLYRVLDDLDAGDNRRRVVLEPVTHSA